MVAPPSCTFGVDVLDPCRVAIEFSILRATSFSSCPAKPRQRGADRHRGQIEVGEVLHLHGENENSPASVSRKKIITDGIGF